MKFSDVLFRIGCAGIMFGMLIVILFIIPMLAAAALLLLEK